MAPQPALPLTGAPGQMAPGTLKGLMFFFGLGRLFFSWLPWFWFGFGGFILKKNVRVNNAA